LQHGTVTTVPVQLGEGEGGVGPTLNEFHAPDGRGDGRARKPKSSGSRGAGNGGRSAVAAKLGTASVVIADVEWRQRVRVTGTISALRVQSMSGTCALECTLVDDTGGISVLFLGRRTIAGIEIGTSLTVEGMVVDHHGRLAIMNPVYEISA